MPAGTAQEVVARVSGEIVKILQMPEVRARLTGIEHTPSSGTAAAMGDRIRIDYDKWGKLIRDTNMNVE